MKRTNEGKEIHYLMQPYLLIVLLRYALYICFRVSLILNRFHLTAQACNSYSLNKSLHNIFSEYRKCGISRKEENRNAENFDANSRDIFIARSHFVPSYEGCIK
jgi:hypothetical protein